MSLLAESSKEVPIVHTSYLTISLVVIENQSVDTSVYACFLYHYLQVNFRSKWDQNEKKITFDKTDVFY